MIRIQAKDVEHFACDKVESWVVRWDMARRREWKKALLWSVHSPPSQSALQGFKGKVKPHTLYSPLGFQGT